MPHTIILKKTVKVFLANILFYSGLWKFYRLLSPADRILILRYHRIYDDNCSEYVDKLGIERSNFEQQARFLAAHCNVISMDEAVDLLKDHQEQLPPNCVVITFDDGYTDNWSNAFPVLQKYRLPATIYLTIGLINERQFMHWDRLKDAIKRTTARRIDLRENSLPLSSPREKKRAYTELLKYFKKIDDQTMREELEKTVAGLLDRPGGDKEDSLLSWEKIRQMHKAGITFGGHTLTHPLLTKVSAQKARHEIERSKKDIEERLGVRAATFAYPGGDFNDEIREIVKECGYKAACSTMSGANGQGANLYALKRKGITEGSSTGLDGKFCKALFAIELSGIFDKLFSRE